MSDEELRAWMQKIEERLGRIEHGMDMLVIREVLVQQPLDSEPDRDATNKWQNA